MKIYNKINMLNEILGGGVLLAIAQGLTNNSFRLLKVHDHPM